VLAWRDVLTRWLSAASAGVVGAGVLVGGPGGPAVAAARAHRPAPWSQLPGGLRRAVGHALGPVQETELAASGPGIATFGVSVAISANGVVAVVGAPSQQLVYVFTRSGPGWRQTAELRAADQADPDEFGFSVAISALGGTVVAGAVEHGSKQRGAAYVFTRSGRGWRQAAELTASDGAREDGLGQSVAISPDGGTVVAAAMSRDTYRGAVYVFTGPGWRQQAELTASDPAIEDFLGWSVATSSAGDEVLAGAVGHDSSAGAVYVFTRRGRSWHQTAELTGTGSRSLGWSVAVSPAGDTVVAGAADSNSYAGAVYVFTRRGTTWSQQDELTGRDSTALDFFGSSVAISPSGSTLLIGASQKNTATGAAYVFTRQGTHWRQATELAASEGAIGDSFGTSVAISAAGSTAIIGAPRHNAGDGAAYIVAGLPSR